MENCEQNLEWLTIHPDDVPYSKQSHYRYKRTIDKTDYIDLLRVLIENNPILESFNLTSTMITVPKGFKSLINFLDKTDWDKFVQSKKINHKETSEEFVDGIALVLNSIWLRRFQADEDGWIDSPTERLRWVSQSWYKLLMKPLINGTDKQGSIIDERASDHEMKMSRSFSISEKYLKRSSQQYELKSKSLISKLFKRRYEAAVKALNDSALIQLMQTYPKLEMPPLEAVRAAGVSLSRKGKGDKDALSKKGRVLINLNKRSKETFLKQSGHDIEGKTKKQISKLFRENYYSLNDHIKIYEDFLLSGFRIPHRQKNGRVDDSITGMPEWIRKLIRTNNEPMMEVDCAALHLNIPFALAKNVSPKAKEAFLKQAGDMHSIIAKYLTIGRDIAKMEALSFQNKRVKDMEKSPIYQYYTSEKIGIMEYLDWLKQTKEKTHRNTSLLLFGYESQIIWSAMRKCAANDITVYQVFDGIGCPKSKVPKVLKILNKALRDYGVPTNAVPPKNKR